MQRLSPDEVLGFRTLLFSRKQLDSMPVHVQANPLVASVVSPTLPTLSLLPFSVLALEGVCR